MSMHGSESVVGGELSGGVAAPVMPESAQPLWTRREVFPFLATVGAAAYGALTGCGSGEATAPAPASPATSAAGETQRPSGEFAATPSWEQDFSAMPDGPIDGRVWRHDLDPAVPGWNDERQGYTNREENVCIKGGMLVIEARRQSYQYPGDPSGNRFEYTSARIDTLGRQDFLYGRTEAEIMLPAGRGTWPALWMLPSSNEATRDATDAMWEKDGRLYLRNGPEIDILEAAGGQPDRIESTVHTYDERGVSTGHTTVAGSTKRFVTYAVEWTPQGLAFFADGRKYHEVTRPEGDNPDMWNADGAHYLILNLAMGGTMGGSISGNGPWRMAVKSLKHYNYVGGQQPIQS